MTVGHREVGNTTVQILFTVFTDKVILVSTEVNEESGTCVLENEVTDIVLTVGCIVISTMETCEHSGFIPSGTERNGLNTPVAVIE